MNATYFWFACICCNYGLEYLNLTRHTSRYFQNFINVRPPMMIKIAQD